jgi:hypothetical protein
MRARTVVVADAAGLAKELHAQVKVLEEFDLTGCAPRTGMVAPWANREPGVT